MGFNASKIVVAVSNVERAHVRDSTIRVGQRDAKLDEPISKSQKNPT